MVNILIEGYDIGAQWLRGELEKYIKPHSRVAVMAFSFRDSQAKNAEEWDALYHKTLGRYYGGMVGGFMEYGVKEQNIRFINYFTDTHESAREAVKNSDILFFPGGLPDRMMERMEEFGLTETLRAFDGVVMGYSAGAMIQLKEYHISPDDDYPEFGYYRGIGWLDGFYLEVHYEENVTQKEAIQRVLRERNRPVYATYDGAGALIVKNGNIKPIGKVKIF